MVIRSLLALLMAGFIQAPSAVETSKIGPQIGQVVPPIRGTDQSGKTQTLTSLAGAKGTMLVFFRSADW